MKIPIFNFKQPKMLFLTLLKNDSKKLFIFLNKHIFRKLKLEKLKEIVTVTVLAETRKKDEIFISSE